MIARFSQPLRGPPHALGAVVIGGSAGSLEALFTILERLPADFALATLVVVHQPREPPSSLAGALAPRCRLPVREPWDKEPIAAATVYLAPPDYHLLVERGPQVAFSLDAPENFSRPSIDSLFESAAEVFEGGGLVGVVLSGANADGARGLAAVHRRGGTALVQAPAEAPNPEMPLAALAACGGAAEPLGAAGIAARLLAVHQGRSRT